MHILCLADEDRPIVRENWRQAGVSSTFVGKQTFEDYLSRVGTTSIADLFGIIDGGDDYRKPEDWSNNEQTATLIQRIRTLRDALAMPDGRKWNSLPVLVLTNMRLYSWRGPRVADLKIEHLSETDLEFGSDEIIKVVHEDRRRILTELDQLGFLVTYQAGRYHLGPALKPRDRLIGDYYYGPGDRRSDAIVTVDRDWYGAQLEVEALEELINRKDVSEVELQRFFETNPHFLSTLAQPLSQPRFRDSAGNILIPDFVLRPIAAFRRDSNWEVLDLKLPQSSLLAGRAGRRRLSAEVLKAIRQLRDYGDYFADPRNVAEIRARLGHALRTPRLGVVIGRLTSVDPDALELEQSRLPDVRIVTYDEILERQRIVALRGAG